MNASAVDGVALLVAALVALVVAGTLILADRGDSHRRAWVAAGVLFLGITAAGVVDLLRSTPRETYVSTVASGALLCVLGSVGMVRGTTRVRPWIRWPLVAVMALVLLLAGLLAGAAFVSRLLPF